MNAVQPLLPQFTELTGIEVKAELQSESEYVAETPIKLGGGSAVPDVYMVWSLGQAISAGWLEPLNGYYADANLIDSRLVRGGRHLCVCALLPGLERR